MPAGLINTCMHTLKSQESVLANIMETILFQVTHRNQNSYCNIVFVFIGAIFCHAYTVTMEKKR